MADNEGTPRKRQLPSYAIFRQRRVQILWYEEGVRRPWHIVDTDDSQRAVSGEDLIFLPNKKPKADKGSS